MTYREAVAHGEKVLELSHIADAKTDAWLLLEMGCKVVVALHMMDLVRANGDVLDTELLSIELGCPVVPITATSGEGVEQLVARAVQIAQTQCDRKDPNSFSEEVERVLQEIGEMVAPMPHIERRWQLVKVFERDGKLLEKLKLSCLL